ncbi:uncharacterized protein LOC124648086 [Lolium rigidum]|uniref:uncharacterized protein LOC124648086 n=1 Tax=Lolium rigidum TaxID=89674 RepID=UPI001F5CCE24|nr:uncharacterized protein LOC124648086 [Lolium rigidum]
MVPKDGNFTHGYGYRGTAYSYGQALGKSPFEVLYGQSPRQLGITSDSTCTVPDREAWLAERQLMQELLRQHLERVRLRMKHQTDKNRTERIFSVGEAVYLKLQPYVQSSEAPRAHHKLLFKYYGPYLVLERVGEVAYRLDLPSTSRIHPVIHVSQLKKAVGANVQVQAALPSPLDILHVPTRILQRRLRQQGRVAVSQTLVQWSGQPESLATWEDMDELKQRFPRSPAWGQAGFQGEANVSNVYLPTGINLQQLCVNAVIDRRALAIRQVRGPASELAAWDWRTLQVLRRQEESVANS